jgi:peroxiredoxin
MIAVVALASLARAEPEMIPVEAMDTLGHEAPDFEAVLRDGRTFKLSEQRGHVVVVTFWASWCSPCRHELPALSALAAKHHDVRWVAVSVDRDRSKADAFLEKMRVDLPIAYDPDARAMGGFTVTSMPTMFLIDSKGMLRFEHVGYSQEKGFAELEKALMEAR